MTRPDTITIYNKFADKYVKTVLRDVYWYGTDSINISGKGIAESNAINIIIDEDNLKFFVKEKEYVGTPKTYTIQKGIRIVHGVGPDVESLNELINYEQITVFSYDINIVESSVDNILIGGK